MNFRIWHTLTTKKVSFTLRWSDYDIFWCRIKFPTRIGNLQSIKVKIAKVFFIVKIHFYPLKTGLHYRPHLRCASNRFRIRPSKTTYFWGIYIGPSPREGTIYTIAHSSLPHSKTLKPHIDLCMLVLSILVYIDSSSNISTVEHIHSSEY